MRKNAVTKNIVKRLFWIKYTNLMEYILSKKARLFISVGNIKRRTILLRIINPKNIYITLINKLTLVSLPVVISTWVET
jgi:hypothetical protein